MDTKGLAFGKIFAFIALMIININLSRFAKRKKVLPAPDGDLIDLAGKVADESAVSSGYTRPTLSSRLIDHGKAQVSDSRPPQPTRKHRASVLVDHGKHDLSDDSHSPLPGARAAAARLIDHGKVT